MTYEQCKEKLLNKHKEARLVASYKSTSDYIFSLKPKDWPEDKYVLDGLFKVSFDGKITEFSVVMNPEEYEKALINRIE